VALPPQVDTSSPAPSFRLAQLAAELVHYREAAGLTQAAAAKILGCTQGRIQKIESGATKTIKRPDLLAILTAYGVPDDEVEELLALSRTNAANRGSYPVPRGVPRWFRRYHKLESQAHGLRTYNPDEPHGLLQHPGYAELMFRLGNATNIADQIRVRTERHKAVFQRETPPECTFILGESALTRTMGDPVIAVAQLRHMLMLSELPRVTILVIPFGAALAYAGNEFILLRFPHDVSSDVAYAETELGAQYWDGERDLARYQRRWEVLHAAALGPHDTRSLIQTKIHQLQQDQGVVQP
jgi:transcriptional regulator with XRE-family HTH domain